MKLVARKPAGASSPRELLTRDRQQAALLRQLFPAVGQVHVKLSFTEAMPLFPAPSPQSFTFYPAASAFFRFSCPCHDCDGVFDLTEFVKQLLARQADSGRALTEQGEARCQGQRHRQHAASRADCPLQLGFQIESWPQSIA